MMSANFVIYNNNNVSISVVGTWLIAVKSLYKDLYDGKP